jgi:hypothetical protein
VPFCVLIDLHRSATARSIFVTALLCPTYLVLHFGNLDQQTQANLVILSMANSCPCDQTMTKNSCPCLGGRGAPAPMILWKFSQIMICNILDQLGPAIYSQVFSTQRWSSIVLGSTQVPIIGPTFLRSKKKKHSWPACYYSLMVWHNFHIQQKRFHYLLHYLIWYCFDACLLVSNSLSSHSLGSIRLIIVGSIRASLAVIVKLVKPL